MKIKLTLKIPSKTPYKGIKLQSLEHFTPYKGIKLQALEHFLHKKKKKTEFHGGISLKFWGVLKTLFGIFRFFNVKSRQRK